MGKIAIIIAGDVEEIAASLPTDSLPRGHDFFFVVKKGQKKLVKYKRRTVEARNVGLINPDKNFFQFFYLRRALRQFEEELQEFDFIIKLNPDFFAREGVNDIENYLEKMGERFRGFHILQKEGIIAGPTEQFMNCFKDFGLPRGANEKRVSKLIIDAVQKNKYFSKINCPHFRALFTRVSRLTSECTRVFRFKNWENFNEEHIRKVRICLDRPVRNTSEHPHLSDHYKEFNSFLEKTNIYVSLSTSPLRIKKLFYPLNTIDFGITEKVIISIPEKYRGEENYEIPSYLERDPQIIFNREFEDVGSISKLTPSLRWLKKNDPSSIVITIDDDTVYPYGMVKEMAYDLFTKEKVVSCGCAQPVRFWGIDLDDWPTKEALVSEGWAGCGYKVGEIDDSMINEMESYAKKFQTCRFSDDLVHSYVLAKNGFSVSEVESEYHGKRLTKQLDYGFREDAIYKGSGLPEFVAETTEGRRDGINIFKYKNCLKEMIKL